MELPIDGTSVCINGTELMVYRTGDVYRKFKKIGWKIVKNSANMPDGYNRIGCGGKMYLRHRIIAYAYLGLNIEDTAQCIDHINGNKIDNTVDNLRIVSNQENQHNHTKAKGYCWNKSVNKWQAEIKINYKVIYIGLYFTEEEARDAYLEAKRIHHPTAPHYGK